MFRSKVVKLYTLFGCSFTWRSYLKPRHGAKAEITVTVSPDVALARIEILRVRSDRPAVDFLCHTVIPPDIRTP